MLFQGNTEPINPADYRFFLITGSIQLDGGGVLPIFTGAHARADDLPDGDEGRTEIAARLLRQARGESETGPEGEAAADDVAGATWRKVFVLELPRAEAVTSN